MNVRAKPRPHIAPQRQPAPQQAAQQAAPQAAQSGLQAMVRYLRDTLRAHANYERFHAIFLDCNRNYLDDVPMGRGNHHALQLRMRDLFGKAIQVEAQAIIIAHSHPSGACRPSQRDIEETRRLAAVARALDISLLDHLIITDDQAYSMRAGGDF